MLDDRESIVPLMVVRHADGVLAARGDARMPARASERVVALRARVQHGYYASAAMMDAVARRILAVGDV